MTEIKIYLETSNKSPKRRNGKVGYVLEKEGFEPLTGIAPAQNLTVNQAEMTALYKALFPIREPAKLIIYTDSMYLANSVGCLEKWKTNGWLNAKGKEVANREAWELIDQKLQGHKVEFRVGDHHPYRKWLETEVRRK